MAVLAGIHSIREMLRVINYQLKAMYEGQKGFLTMYKKTFISCSWRTEKAEDQAQALTVRLAKFKRRLDSSLIMSAKPRSGTKILDMDLQK